MAKANVRFGDMACNGLELDEDQPGPGQEARFGFDCPRHKGRRCEGLLIIGEASGVHRTPDKTVAAWDFDGNRDAPTFSPSVNCGGCWHGYIRAGRCVDTNNNDEPEPT